MAKSVSRLRKKKSAGLAGKPWIWLLGAVVLVFLVTKTGAYLRQRKLKEALGAIDTIRIETNKGSIVVEVYPELVPVTVANFEELAEAGFYDGLIWHRVEDWVAQTGDPEGTGYGGSDKTIELEIAQELGNIRGAVGMARSQDPDSASSQFYILKRDAQSLDGAYCIFGNVVEGMDVVDKLAIGDNMLEVTVERRQ